jgi:outer membrane lipoprotein-sorting protein
MKGTKVLTASPTQMYIYLPAMKKIRRIASHVTEQGFLGTALSQRDMTLTRYGDKYTAKIDSDGAVLAMTLTAKNADAPYPKLELEIDKKIWLPTKVKYLNEAGKVIKTETRTSYECDENYCNPREMVMTDHTSGVSSTLQLKKFKINPELSDDLFSKRSLMH